MDQIVSNIFPAAIRDRLYGSEKKDSQRDNVLDTFDGGDGPGKETSPICHQSTRRNTGWCIVWDCNTVEVENLKRDNRCLSQ
eukprot:scaffold12472_cov115-Cylindrotheca_fusiformis.AAC.4